MVDSKNDTGMRTSGFPFREPDLGTRWYVVHCKPARELHAVSALKEGLELVSYLPQVCKQLRGKIKQTPLFPGYLFVQADLGQVAATSINGTPGVVQLLRMGGKPQWVPDTVVQAIQERVDRLNAGGGLPNHSFQIGDQVRLKRGPLRGLNAVFMGPMTPAARVSVLLEFLGRMNQVQVEVDYLERSYEPPKPQHQRTTRGRGRTINYKTTSKL
jgi:transcriptional antiterminator RfaH